MPKGASDILKIAQQNKGSSYTDSNILYFRLKNEGESATVRFLEEGEDINYAWTHQLPPVGKAKWGEDYVCLDQDGRGENPCPMCEMVERMVADGHNPKELDMSRSFSGWINLVWRDGPVYGKTEDGYTDYKNIVGRGDIIATWNSGIRLFENLVKTDRDSKGLTRRDFLVTAEKSGWDRTYRLTPAMDSEGNALATPMSDEDNRLAEEKPDLTPFITPLPYDKMKTILDSAVSGQSGGTASQEQDLFGGSPSSDSGVSNPFDSVSDTSAFG
jgi:hypothetical protein